MDARLNTFKLKEQIFGKPKRITGIEQEQQNHLNQVIKENEITADQFSSYIEFLRVSNYGVAKCSEMWLDMIATRDKWPAI